MEKYVCQFHVRCESTRKLTVMSPSLSPQPASGTPQPHWSTQNDHISRGSAASLLALPNTWANSLCHFCKAVHGTRNTAALLCLPNPPMKCHFPGFFLPLLNKIISIIKVPFFFFSLSPTFFIFSLEKYTHLQSVGLGQELFTENTNAGPAFLQCFSIAKSALSPF